MVISPNDFSLWARLTGNKYPSTPAERAKKGPEVHNFIQNLDKEGMLGGKEPEQPKKEKNLAEKVATGALIAGGVAAAVAAGRDPRVQNVAKKAASATKTKIDDFLSNLGKTRVVDVDIVDASGDVTPDPRQQQSNVAPQLTGTSAAGRLTSIGNNQVRDPELGLVTFDKGATPEQINNTLTSIKMDRALDRKAKEGNLTRKDERQFLKKELIRSGTTPQELFGTDTIDSYLDQMATQGAFGANELIRTVRKESPTREIRPQGPMPPEISIESVAADASVNPFSEDQEEIVREHAQLKGLGYGREFGTYEDRDPVSGYRYEDIKNKLQSIATKPERDRSLAKFINLLGDADPVKQPVTAIDTFKPAVEGKTFGTSGAVSKPEDIGDAKLRARRTYGPMIDAIQQKNPGINVGGMGRTMLTKAEQDRDYDLAYMVARGQGKSDADSVQIARATAGFPTDSPVGKPTPYREFLGEQRTSSIRKESIDNLLKLVQPGPQINLPESVQEPGALVQLAAGSTPSNKVPTMGATIGGSSLTDKHATKMAVDNALDAARDNYEKTVSAIVEAGQTKGGSISTASRAERFLQRAKPDVVKNLDTAIEQDLEKTTGLNPEDASNIAGSIINPITGQREISSVQKAGLKMAMKGATRKPFEERSIPNIDPETNQGTIKTAVGTSIRGRAPSYDQARFVERTREDINDPKGGDLPDIQGGISGPSAQELLKRKSGELMQYTGKRPAGQEFTSETRLSPTTVPNTDIDPQTGKPKGGVKLGPLVETAGAKPLGERAPRTPVRRIISPAADQGDPGPGVGIYGEGTGFLPGPFSSTAEKAPTDTFGKSSPFKGVSDSTLTKLKSDIKPGTKSFESVDKEQKGRASMDAARELRKIQTSGDPSTSTERVAKFLDNLKKQQGG